MNGRALPGFPILFFFFIGENVTNAEFKVLGGFFCDKIFQLV
jgi:hypothetical protein